MTKTDIKKSLREVVRDADGFYDWDGEKYRYTVMVGGGSVSLHANLNGGDAFYPVAHVYRFGRNLDTMLDILTENIKAMEG